MTRNNGDMAIPEIGFNNLARTGNTEFTDYYKNLIEQAKVKRLKAPISFDFGAAAADSSNKAALNFRG